jgi:hypothetical protein
MDVVLHPAMQERYLIIPISVLSQSTLVRFILSSIRHCSTRWIKPLHVQVVLPIPLMLLLDRLRSPPLYSGVLPPLAAATSLLSALYYIHPRPLAPLYSLNSLRSYHTDE